MNSQETKYPIDEYTKVISFKVDSFTIATLDVVPFTSATIVCNLYFNENPIGTQRLIMQGEDYNAWTNDDDYLINWIKQQLPLNSQ